MLFGLSTKALGAIGGAIVLVGVVAGTAAVLADDGDYGTIAAPVWESGYTWAYDISGHFDYVVNVPGEISDAASLDFGPFAMKKEILNTQDFNNDGEDLYLGAATIPIGHILSLDVFALEDWADLAVFPTADRHRDLAPTFVIPEYDCSAYDCEASDLSFGPNTNLDYIQFPITYGKQWSESIELEDELGLDGMDLSGAGMEGITEIKMIGEAGRMETIELPMGTTDAVRLDFSYQPVGLQKVIADMREQVEQYGVDVERLNVQIGLHEIAHYSPEYQAVVQDQFVVRFLVDAAIVFDGDRIEFFSEASAYTVAQLTGAELANVQERSMPEILDILNGRETIKDVQGQTISTIAPYTVELSSHRSTVNAANGGEVVRFGLDVDGGLPEGHTAEYVVVDYFGKEVQRGQAGETFDIVFDEPGTFTVLAGAFDHEGRLISQDGTVVTANYIDTVGASCQLGGSAFLPCESTNVPVRGGLEKAILRLNVNQTLPDTGFLNSGFYFEDADGQTTYGSNQGGGVWVIELDGDDVAASSRDGELNYQPLVGTLETYTYDIVLMYGDMPQVAHATTASSVGLQTMFGDWRAIGSAMEAVSVALEGLTEGDVYVEDAVDLLHF